MSEIIQFDPKEEQLDNFIVPVEPGFFLADNGRVATEFYQAGNEVVFVNKGRRISWTPNDMRYIDEFGMEDTIYTVQEVPLETKGNYARYNRAMPDVDDWFIQENDRLKHQILIQGFQPDPSPWLMGNIDFAVGGKMKFDSDLKIFANGQEQINPFETHGAIQLYEGEQLIFELPQIIAFDSAYDRKGTSGKYRVWFNDNAEMMFDIIIDYEWISSMERVYPVVIDPTVIVNSGYSLGSPTGRKGVELANGWLVVGVYDSTNKKIILLKSADKGTTWTQLCYVQEGSVDVVEFAISSYQNTIHLALNFNDTTASKWTVFLKLDALTVSNTNVYNSSNRKAVSVAAQGFNGVSIFTEPSGTIHIASSIRIGSMSYHPYNIYYTSSSDGGETWSSSINLTNYNDDIYKAYKPIVMVTNGKPFVVFEFVEGGTYYGISIAYFTGSSWIHRQNGIRSSGQSGAVLPCPAVDKSGIIHVVWQENSDFSGKMNILYSKSTDGGSTWSTPVDLTPTDFRKEAPILTIGKNGNLYVFLRGGNFDGSVGFYQLSRIIHNGTSWSAEEYLTSYTSQKNITLTALFDPTHTTSLVGWAWSDGTTVQFEKIVLNQAPNAPILTAKTNFDSTSAADFFWTYSDPDPSDTQSAYQLQVKDVSTGSIVHDTGKVASTTAKRTISSNTLANGKQYQWRVKTWDSTNTEGAYSDYATFYTSAKPTVTITNITEGQTYGGSTITPEWSMSDPESEGQSAYRIELLSAVDAILWDSGKVLDSRARSRTVGFNLENNTTYKIRMTVWDAKDIPSASVTRSLNVAYTPPMVPQLVTSTNSSRGSISVEVVNDDNVVEFANPLVADFTGKIAGSTAVNPHTIKVRNHISLEVPSGTWYEIGSDSYEQINKLDSVIYSLSTTTNGEIPQQLFSFNLIEEIKRKTGVTLSVEQAKEISTKLTCDWYGYGIGPSGNKATFIGYDALSSSWYASPQLFTHTSSAVSRITFEWLPVSLINSNGFVHYLAYTDPSNGTVASTINTDYVQLSIEFDYKKLVATLPKVISNEVYRRIVGELDWKRIGYVQPKSYGENLLPPFTEWNNSFQSKVISPYEIEMITEGHFTENFYLMPSIPNQIYTFSGITDEAEGYCAVYSISVNNEWVALGDGIGLDRIGKTAHSFTTPADSKYLRVMALNHDTAGTFHFRELMLTLGIVEKTFSPQKFGGNFTDYTPASERAYEYKVKAVGSNLSSAESSVAAASVPVKDVILSKASDPKVFVKLIYNPSRNEKRSRERALSQFAGRQDPVAEFGNARSFNLDASFSILDKAELDTLRMLVDSGDILLYRDGRGRREFVSLADITITDEKPTYYQVSIPMTRVSYEEGV